MIPLVTKLDTDKYKYISDSLKNSVTWPEFVSEAQLFDVKGWLGDELLNEIANQVSISLISAANQILLDGGTYVYNSKTYLFQGLKAAIIYYGFSRFANRTSVNFTAAGVVVKDSDFSTPASDKQIQRIVTEAQLMAEAIKCEITTFLDRNYILYPLWKNQECRCGASCSNNRPFIAVGN